MGSRSCRCRTSLDVLLCTLWTVSGQNSWTESRNHQYQFWVRPHTTIPELRIQKESHQMTLRLSKWRKGFIPSPLFTKVSLVSDQFWRCRWSRDLTYILIILTLYDSSIGTVRLYRFGLSQVSMLSLPSDWNFAIGLKWIFKANNVVRPTKALTLLWQEHWVSLSFSKPRTDSQF